MSKTNLILIAIISLIIFLTGNAFAQPGKFKKKAKKPVASSSSQKTNAAKQQTNSNQTTGKTKVVKPLGKIHAEKNQDIEVEIAGKPKMNSASGGAANNNYIGETEKNVKKVVKAPKSPNQNKVKKNQDIEVENDETHRTKNRRVKP